MSKYASLLGNEDVELLQQTLGLRVAELSVYLAALELGGAHAQELSRKSGVRRTSLYNFLATLEEKHLISLIKKGKRKFYVASGPASVLQSERSQLVALEKLLPELLAISNAAKHKPRVRFHEGIQGMQEIYNEMLHDKNIIFAWEDLESMFSLMPKSFTTNYPIRRAAKNIPLRSIVRDSRFARKFCAENNKSLARDSRFINSEHFGTDIEIFGDKVAFFSLRKYAPFGVLIEDKDLAHTLKIIWQAQWDQLERATFS